MLTGKKAQSTLEYIIIFTAIVGAILYAANQSIRPSIKNMLNDVSCKMENAVNNINF